MQVDKRLIVALDVNDMNKVCEIVEALGERVVFYKVGMELYYSVGVTVINYLKRMGKEIFLDLKLHDIPNTVAQGAGILTRLGASMLTLHTGGGPAMMRAAAMAVAEKAAELGVPRPKLIGVTVLTSINESEWTALGHKTPVADHVVHLAKLAQRAGLDGVVASPREAALIRRACGDNFLVVTPGIRPVGVTQDDQSRIATPSAALAAGATHLVIGRPITAAPNIAEAACQVIREMAESGLKF